ncbi:hypothetical protein OFL77_27710, partial [Escherichia coli]|uniref:hypothetical protein n=1 Tax=Escherichia coli TaxID=562 RepID=UPI0021E0E508
LWVYDQLNKTNGSFINSGNLDKNIIKIDKWLDNQFFNIHINNMNDENKTVRLTKNNVIEELKYTDFLKDTVKVNFRGNE